MRPRPMAWPASGWTPVIHPHDPPSIPSAPCPRPWLRWCDPSRAICSWSRTTTSPGWRSTSSMRCAPNPKRAALVPAPFAGSLGGGVAAAAAGGVGAAVEPWRRPLAESGSAPPRAMATLAFDSARYVGARIGIFDPSGRKVGRVSHLKNRELLVIVGAEDLVRRVVDAIGEGAIEASVRPIAPPAVIRRDGVSGPDDGGRPSRRPIGYKRQREQARSGRRPSTDGPRRRTTRRRTARRRRPTADTRRRKPCGTMHVWRTPTSR